MLSVNQLDDTILSAQRLRSLTSEDPLLSRVKDYVLHGWAKHLEDNDPQMQPFFHRKLELTVAQGLLYWGHRVVVPQTARGAMLKMLHETHQGASAMKAVARTLLW